MISRLLVPAAVVLSVLLLAEACGVGTSAAPGETPVERPPLDDPPDPGPVPDSDGLSDEARDRMVASTVRISGVACGVEHEGSGFAVGDDLVATNAHVLVGVEEPMIDLVDGRRLEAVIVAFDPVADLAVLRVPGAGLVPFELGTAADGTLGTLIGWEAADRPEPTPFRIDRPVTVRIDEVASFERVERRSWLVAAEIEAGDSGAALVDADGVVVGVAYATTRREAGVAYAVRASELEALLAAGDLTSPVVVPDC